MSKAELFEEKIWAVRRADKGLKLEKARLDEAAKQIVRMSSMFGEAEFALRLAFCGQGGIILDINTCRFVNPQLRPDASVTKFGLRRGCIEKISEIAYRSDSSVCVALVFADRMATPDALRKLQELELISSDKEPLIIFRGEYFEWLDGDWHKIVV